MLRGEANGGVLGAVALVTSIALEKFEEDAADGAGVAVAEGAARVAVVEDAEFLVDLQLVVREVEAGGEVVVVVGGDLQQAAAAWR